MSANASDDPIHDWVHQQIPEKLWHYTSIQGFQGFQGIVGSGNIYATDVRFLNDAEEFVHIRKVADDLLEKTPKFGDFGYPLRESLGWLVDQIFKSDFLDPHSAQIFVASFTDSEDDLSQWRAYSHGTHGASVSFDLRWIRPPVESDSAVTFAPCVYQDEEKRVLIQHALNQFMSVTQSWWNGAAQKFVNDYISKGTVLNEGQIASFTSAIFGTEEYKSLLLTGLIEARKRIVRLAGLLKHRAFHHEREWRLVLPISPNKDKSNLIHPIKFRPANASLVPYIEFPLMHLVISQISGMQPTPLLPVNDVMLGPGAGINAQSATSEFLKSMSIEIAPRLSDVPYRQA